MGRVLVVDDSAFILKIQIAILKKAGVMPIPADSGDKAIELLNSEQFDLVLMDMQMPQKDGLATTQEIRQFNQTIPIVALTGNESEEDVQNCLDVGMNGVLHKPLNINDFISLYNAL